MAGSRERRRRRQAQVWSQHEEKHDAATRRKKDEPDHRPGVGKPAAINIIERLSRDLLAEVHHRLTFLDRVAFALICRDSGVAMKPDDTRPWLLIPKSTPTAATGATKQEQATIFSVADRKSAAVPTCDPAMREHVVVGSSHGWLVTADVKAALRVANPLTGAQADLPPIATLPLFSATGQWFMIEPEALAKARYGGGAALDPVMWGLDKPSRSFTLTAEQMREGFYRKVVLSASPRAAGGYAAMLVLDPNFGIPAFATSEDPVWRTAPSRDGVEDAVCHDGRFYSITYSGVVEAWDRDSTGRFASKEISPRLVVADAAGAGKDNMKNKRQRRKYLAVAPDRRFIVAVKESSMVAADQDSMYGRRGRRKWACTFKVHVLDASRQRWEEATKGIGDAALFVGINSSAFVPPASTTASTTTTKGRRHTKAAGAGIRANCVYYADDDTAKPTLRRHRENLRPYSHADEELKFAGVYNLGTGKVESIGDPDKHPCWPLPAWFTPSVI